MSTNYPGALDTLTNPSAGDPTTSPSHAAQHANANDAIEALQAKVGADSSAVTTSHDYKLGEVTSTDKAVGKTATQTLTNKTLTSPVINLGSNATGDIYYRDSGGAFQRLAIGSTAQILNVDASGIPAWVSNPSVSSATTTTEGIVELATDAETETKSSDAVVMTPGNLGSIFLDEDDMASDSATKLASQQSIKAYVDNSGDNFQGVGSATNVKTYWNFQIPFIVSTNVPSGDFWTLTNLDAPAYGTSWAKPFPASDATSSLLTTNAIFANFGSAVEGIKFDTTKKVIVEFMLEASATGSEQQGFGLTESNAPFIDYDDASVDAACFTVDASGNLYGHTSAGGGTTLHTETSITGVTLTDANTYRIEFDPGVDVKFYVNGVLKATNTTNLPSTAQPIKFGCGSQGNTSSNGAFMITAPQFAIEK